MTKRNQFSTILPIAVRCAVCGSVTGAIIFFFKYLAGKIEHLSRELYAFGNEKPIFIPLIFAVVILLSVLTFLLHKKAPEVRGGGIPRSEGILRGILSYRPIVTLFGTVLGSLISFFCGLPLGSEGPAVLIGTSAGGCLFKRRGKARARSRYIMTGGAAAGFAVATCAPFSAMLFALEEIHKRLTPILVMSASVSVLCATYVNKALCGAFGVSPRLFELDGLPSFTFKCVPYLLALALIISVAVALFDSSIDRFSALCGKIAPKFPKGLGIIAVFLVCAALGFVFPEALYSGHHVIEELTAGSETVLMLSVILAFRVILMLFMTGSGATGGIFIPTLAIGALTSALGARLLIVIGMPQELYSSAVIIGMCAFIGGTLRAPLTAAVLFAELTASFSDFFYVSVVIFTVILVTDSLNLVPFYDRVLDNLERAQNMGKERCVSYFEMVISEDAFARGKAVRDIMWPHASVVVSVKRRGAVVDDTDNDGEKIIRSGDRIIIRARYYDEARIRRQLRALVGQDTDIRVLGDDEQSRLV